jgi:hypothetical protein
VSDGTGDGARRCVELGASSELQPNVPAWDQPFELVGGSLGNKLALVEQRDPVGELVGLLEVLSS